MGKRTDAVRCQARVNIMFIAFVDDRSLKLTKTQDMDTACKDFMALLSLAWDFREELLDEIDTFHEECACCCKLKYQDLGYVGLMFALDRDLDDMVFQAAATVYQDGWTEVQRLRRRYNNKFLRSIVHTMARCEYSESEDEYSYAETGSSGSHV